MNHKITQKNLSRKYWKYFLLLSCNLGFSVFRWNFRVIKESDNFACWFPIDDTLGNISLSIWIVVRHLNEFFENILWFGTMPKNFLNRTKRTCCSLSQVSLSNQSLCSGMSRFQELVVTRDLKCLIPKGFWPILYSIIWFQFDKRNFHFSTKKYNG